MAISNKLMGSLAILEKKKKYEIRSIHAGLPFSNTAAAICPAQRL